MKTKLLFLLLIFLISFAFVSAFSGSGDGSVGNPFQITNCTQLQEIVGSNAFSYILVNDIDCSDTVNWNSGRGFLAIGSFDGNLNGQGYTISNLFSSSPPLVDYATASTTGLFGSIVGNCNITNLHLDNQRFYGRVNSSLFSVGGIANNMITGTGNNRPRIINVSLTNAFLTLVLPTTSSSTQAVGGIIGSGAGANPQTTRYILNSSFQGIIAVNGNTSVGGLVGILSDGATLPAGVPVIDSTANVDLYISDVFASGFVYGSGNASLIQGTTSGTGNVYAFDQLPLQYTYKPIIRNGITGLPNDPDSSHLSAVFVSDDGSFSYTYHSINPNNVSVTWSDNSSLFDINPTTGEILYTASNNDLGEYQIRITLTDGLSRTDTDDFTLTVYSTENAPSTIFAGGMSGGQRDTLTGAIIQKEAQPKIGLFASISNFFQNILNWFRNLFK